MASQSSDPSTPRSRLPTSVPSSPPEDPLGDSVNKEALTKEEKELQEEEEKARTENAEAEARESKKKSKSKPKDKTPETDLETLLAQSEQYGHRLREKSKALGRVGTGMDGNALGEHDLQMEKQPECMIGGTMRDYQLEGLTWLAEVAVLGLSGILADEMGLGKTIQIISLVAHLRERWDFYGPFLIIAPVSTLSNWMDEFKKWAPSIPVVLYHGDKTRRAEIFKSKMSGKKNMVYNNNMRKNRPTEYFPVVLTSPEMVLREKPNLSKIFWDFIIVDEGHRMKNSESKLTQVLKEIQSQSRILMTGTPLQNNLKELWSLLNFLMPGIFKAWHQFEAWFDFSDLKDESKTEEFIQDKKMQELMSKLHFILQPMLLRRVKADVEHLMPKKREYILYAPMTKEQTDIYNAISDKSVDVRKFLEDKVVERLTQAAAATKSNSKNKKSATKVEMQESNEDTETRTLPIRNGRKNASDAPKNAFQQMMQKKSSPIGTIRGRSKGSLKRKSQEELITPSIKSAKSSRNSTPASRLRNTSAKKTYVDVEASDEDELSDREFERRLRKEAIEKEREEHKAVTQVKTEDESFEELARKEIAGKKLDNALMQLRLICNSPHNFFNVWPGDSRVDETLVTSSGKMMLLDRLLNALFERDHRVLVFSQFQTQLDLIEDYARELRGWNVCRVDGTVAQDDRRQQIEEFNTNPEYKLFLLSTRAGGQGINLSSADTVILFDSDWNPQQDLQAQDRVHRIGQKKPVVIFRLATKGTVEEVLLKSAQGKRRLEKAVIKKSGYKASKSNAKDGDIDGGVDELKELLMKDGQVYKYSGDKEILSDKDLDVLCDRRDEAYEQAERGLGNTAGYEIVETKPGGLITMI